MQDECEHIAENMTEVTRVSHNGQLKLSQNELEEITETLIAKARSGDSSALKLVMERTIPAIKPITPFTNACYHLEESSSLQDWYECLIEAVLCGQISFEQALAYLSIVKNRYKLVIEDNASIDILFEGLTAVMSNISSTTKH